MKIIAVASGKGGLGKSCVAAYTGLALARAGKKTLIAELGHDPRSIDIIIGLSDTALFSVQDVLSGNCTPDQAVTVSGLHENLHLLPCSLSTGSLSVGGKELDDVTRKLGEEYDYLILDGVDFSVLPADRAHLILNIVTPDGLAIRSAAELTQRLYDSGAAEVRLVINSVPAQVIPMKGFDDFDDVIDFIGARLLAVIPESPKLRFASNNTEDVDADSIIPRIFDALAARLEGENVPLLIR